MSRHDRMNCKPWCGRRYRHESVPTNAFLAIRTTSTTDPGWCSTHCRDLAAPPLEVSPLEPQRPMGGGVQDHSPGSEPAAKADRTGGRGSSSAVSPVPAVGQRWRGKLHGVYRPEPHVFVVDSVGPRFVNVSMNGEKWLAEFSWFYDYACLGPTPPAVSPPGEVLGQGPTACKPLCGQPRSAWARAGQLLPYLPIGHEHVSDPVGWCCEAKWNRGHGPAGTPPAQPVRHKQISTVPTEEGKPSPADATSSPARREWFIGMPNLPKHPLGPGPGIKCSRCLVTSAAGDVHTPTCVVMRERGPSAAEAAPGRVRDTFADLADEWDLLPEASR